MMLCRRGWYLVSKNYRVCHSLSPAVHSTSINARDAARKYKPGDNICGYTINRVVEVQDFYMTAVMLQHDKTGAQHLHAARDDDNNAFSVMFRTTPMDSTGVAHILEHTALCGSQRFPVRDPFFKMLSRSLATFMNALTGNDWTMYPFSSQNPKDFQNLLSVYLDAVFRPLMRELDFCQEGWRLEQEDPSNVKSALTFKGVVYNEMKGVFSSSQNLFGMAAQNQLLPSHTYGIVSGGDPRYIPDLTWQQLKAFHATHYHPSNAKFFTYGNFPLLDHLEYLNTYLQRFDRIPVSTSVPNEPRWSAPRQHKILCPPDPMAPDPNKQTTAAVSYLLSDITDTFEAFKLQVVCSLLTDGESSPFYKALLASNIGSDYAPITGYQGETKDASFAVGLQGISDSDVKTVLQIIDQTLDKVIEEGFEQERLDALLHKIELGLKHQTANFGVHLTIGLASKWIHDGDPVAQIQVNQMVQQLRFELEANPKLLQDTVRRYMKENLHQLTLTMSPDPDYVAKQLAEENDRLAKKVSMLTDLDRENIKIKGIELLQKQMAQEDLSCLPSLKVDDIDPLVKPEVTEMTTLSGIPVQYSKQPTNGVTYIRMVSSIAEFPSHLISLLPMFCSIITRIGAGGKDYVWMSQQQEMYTGGLSASTHVSCHHTDPDFFQQAVVFSSYCLERNLGKMLELWHRIFTSPDFTDSERLATLIRMIASELAVSVPEAGHSYALAHAASSLNPAAALVELFSGMSQVTLMKKIAETSDLTTIVQQLHEIVPLVLNKQNLRTSVNATPEALDNSLLQVESFLQGLPGHCQNPQMYKKAAWVPSPSGSTHFELPFSVNYVARSYPAVPYTHPDRPSLNVLGALLSRKFLHREIREKGGAYGSGAVAGDNVFSFFSFRDPHNTQTLSVFEQSVEWAATGQFTQQDLDEAKISVFQGTDKPVTPGNQGKLKFLNSISDEMRQTYRDHLFAVTRDDIIRAARKYLKDPSQPQAACCLGPATQAFQEDSRWTVIREQ